MNAAQQAEAVFEEFRSDAARDSARAATGFRGEVKAPFNGGIEYKVVCAKGQVTCYVDSKKVAKAAFIASLTEALEAESF